VLAVTSFDAESELYHVCYSDGDEEDLDGAEIEVHFE
jgi:hypothetical protein